MTTRRPLHIRIVGTNMPGRVFGEHRHVHVGVQCRKETVDFVPGDAAEAAFEFDVDVLRDDGDGWDFRGPYVHGPRGERFIYLVWADLLPGSEATMFRRAKLHLSCLDAGLIADAAEPGRQLTANLALTDGRGGPRCASVRPPEISWSAA
jgi:hypothetical protein